MMVAETRLTALVVAMPLTSLGGRDSCSGCSGSSGEFQKGVQASTAGDGLAGVVVRLVSNT